MNRRTLLASGAATLGMSAIFMSATAQTTERKTIATGLAQVDAAARRTWPTSYSENVLSREIETALTATRKFDVVSRSSAVAGSIADEIQLTKSGGRNAQRAQLLMSIEVLGVDLRSVSSPVPNYADKKRVQSVGRMELMIEVVSTSDRSVSTRFPISASVEGPSTVYDASEPQPAQTLGFVDLAKVAAKKVADRILDQVYPVKIIGREGATVFINRGVDSGYTRGQVLRVFTGDGALLIDPDTREVLGRREVQVGTVRVTETLPKSATAQIVTETGEIKEGSIVRQ